MDVIDAISQLNDLNRNKGIKLLRKIFNNILADPLNKKYHDLNWNRLSTQIQGSTIFIDILCSAGFKKSVTGKRLLFDSEQLNKLKLVNDILLQYKSSQNKQTNNIHNNTYTEQYNAEQTKAINQLISMGFDKEDCIYAFIHSDDNIHRALQYLLNMHTKHSDLSASEFCNGNVEQCSQLKKLRKIMLYQINEEQQQHHSNVYETYSNDMVKILDYFNHLLSTHNRADHEFELLYNSFGGECIATNCESIKSHYRPRTIQYGYNNVDNNTEEHKQIDDAIATYKTLFIKECIDTIHCHVHHAYDIGVRLTRDEKKRIDEIKNDDPNTFQQDTTNALRDILDKKRIEFEKITDNHKHSIKNKFASNLHQSIIGKSADNITKFIPQYSYSFPFNYQEELKDCKEINFLHFDSEYEQETTMGRYCDLYVPAKHKTLKEELINNKLCKIDIESWTVKMEKALCLKQTQNAKKIHAKTQNYAETRQDNLDHPMCYGYVDGSPITENHLVALIIYCSFDELQRKFSETCRRLDINETFQDIIKKHSNYHHFGKYLKESTEVFGTEYMNGFIKRMYHGIDKEMIFSELKAFIFAPVSTTYEWEVAVQFSCQTGLVIELVPEPNYRYFKCEWLSPYPYEGEILFVGGWHFMNIVNITNTEFGWELKEFVTALAIIDSMSHGMIFMVDPAHIHRMNHPTNKEVVYTNISFLKLPNISIWDKRRCLALIHHELNKNGYETDKYLQYTNLHPYKAFQI